jgi:hypothetical protein
MPSISPTADQAVFASAAEKWQSVIVGDLTGLDTSGFPPRSDSCKWPVIIDDMFICAEYKPIDGPANIVGILGPEYTRKSNGLPVSGTMTYDVDDLVRLRSNTEGVFQFYMLHAMGFVLGKKHVTASSSRSSLLALHMGKQHSP